jgi:soluble P-type ATPase
MKTIADVRKEIADLKIDVLGISFNRIVFFGYGEDRTSILFQIRNTDKVVEILESNEDIIDYFTIADIGVPKIIRKRGEKKTIRRGW